MNPAEMKQGVETVSELEELRCAATRRLLETGERTRIVELLRHRLYECGWKEEVAANCKELVKQHGVDNVTVDELVKEVTPIARKAVPDAVKQELLTVIKKFFETQMQEERG